MSKKTELVLLCFLCVQLAWSAHGLIGAIKDHNNKKDQGIQCIIIGDDK
jgi:hypothetical protein